MAGFMSSFGGLTALSTVGALAKGFAQGMNEQLIAEQESRDLDKKMRAQAAIADFKAKQKQREKMDAAQTFLDDLNIDPKTKVGILRAVAAGMPLATALRGITPNGSQPGAASGQVDPHGGGAGDDDPLAGVTDPVLAGRAHKAAESGGNYFTYNDGTNKPDKDFRTAFKPKDGYFGFPDTNSASGAYGFKPDIWKEWAEKYNKATGLPVDFNNPADQDHVHDFAYKQVGNSLWGPYWDANARNRARQALGLPVVNTPPQMNRNSSNGPPITPSQMGLANNIGTTPQIPNSGNPGPINGPGSPYGSKTVPTAMGPMSPDVPPSSQAATGFVCGGFSMRMADGGDATEEALFNQQANQQIQDRPQQQAQAGVTPMQMQQPNMRCYREKQNPFPATPNECQARKPFQNMPPPQTMSDACPPSQPQAGQQFAQNAGYGWTNPSNQNAPYTPEERASTMQHQRAQEGQWKIENQMKASQQEREDRFRAQQMYMEQQRLDQAKAAGKATYTPGIKADEEYLTGKNDGLFKRFNDLTTVQKQLNDIQLMSDAIDRGFKASRPQQVFDEWNRLAEPLLGVSLPGANLPDDVTLVNKATSASILSQLQTYHFGRILEKEVDLTKNSILNSGATPSTNVKVMLLMKAVAQNQAEGVTKEMAAARPNGATPTPESIAAANKIRQDNMSNIIDAPLPWVKMNDNNIQQKIQSAIPGQWMEDENTGQMYKVTENHTLVPAGVQYKPGKS